MRKSQRRSPTPPPPVYRCDACGQHYNVLAQHFVRHPGCRLQYFGSDGEDSDEEAAPPPKPPSSLADEAAEGCRLDWVSNDVSDMRFEHGLDGPAIDFVKHSSRRWLDLAARTSARRLAPLLKDGVSREAVLEALAFDLFKDLGSPKQEAAYMRKNLPYLEPRVAPLGDADGDVVSFDLGDLLERKLQNDPSFRRACIEKSDEWKRGELWQQSPSGVMRDLDDGVAARFHPELMRPATVDEALDLRIGIILNADDVEVANPLGTAAGEHKECGVQAATVNVPTTERMAERNIFLVVLAKAKLYKTHGMARVIAGIDKDGVQHSEPNHAADMRALDRGRWIQIPDDSGNEIFIKVRLRAWQLVFSGDYLGAQSMLPTSECPQAHVFCRGCDYHAKHEMAGRPFSFHRAEPAFAERHWPTLKAELERLRAGVSAGELKKKFHDLGLNKLYFALDPAYIPYVDPTQIAPQDLLHLLPDGLLRSELAWLMYVLCRSGFNLDRLNRRLKESEVKRLLPADVRIPAFPSKLTKGIAGSKPESGRTVRMTGSQCMHFSLHSFAVINPLLTPEMRADPAWKSWLKLVEIFAHVVQHEIPCADIELIDDLVLDHSAAFDQVPEYHGLKRPKHHFMCHLAADIWRYGPPRGYWCFGFEAFNKVIKRGAQRSNWKNTTLSIMQYWSARSARTLSKQGG